jgi:hypothetical protein
MHKIEYTKIAKLILRASKKVNGARTVVSARWSLAMRGREHTALLDKHRRRQSQSLAVGALEGNFIRPPKFDLQIQFGACDRGQHHKGQGMATWGAKSILLGAITYDSTTHRHLGGNSGLAVPKRASCARRLARQSCHLFSGGFNARVEIFGQIQKMDASCAFLACFHSD